jgi:hypothetical protein
LVFIGKKASSNGGIWTFVTDSTGKKVLWEKERLRRPYQTDTSAGNASAAFSVCATDDGGFTIVGDMRLSDAVGGENGLIVHFVPKPVSASFPPTENLQKHGKNFTLRLHATKLEIQGKIPECRWLEVSLFDISGKCIFRKSGNAAVSIDMTGKAGGAYFIQVQSATGREIDEILWGD